MPSTLTDRIRSLLVVAALAASVATGHAQKFHVSTFAGTPELTGFADGVGLSARFGWLRAIAVDSEGALFVADYNNRVLRRILPSGAVGVYAGAVGQEGIGAAEGSVAQVRFSWRGPAIALDPFYLSSQAVGLAFDASGNLYVSDCGNHVVKKITPTGLVTTLAGLGGTSGFADGKGSEARFLNPAGVAVDSGGNVYVADSGNGSVRRITQAGVVTSIAGNVPLRMPYGYGSVDGIGPAAQFERLGGLVADKSGYLYATDSKAGTIRRITAVGGAVTTLAGDAGKPRASVDGLGTAARFASPWGIAIDERGILFVADFDGHTIRRIDPADGNVTTIAGLAGQAGAVDGLETRATFRNPSGVSVDKAGVLHVTDMANHTVRRIEAVAAPAIVGQPQSSTVALGQSASFTVIAKAVPPPSYQWFKDGVRIEGATQEVLKIERVRTEDVGSYLVVVSNEIGEIASAAANLAANGAPTIGTQPSSQTVDSGGMVTLAVSVTSTLPVTYQWMRNGNAIPGATGRELILNQVQAGDAGSYSVRITNAAGSLTSAVAVLEVRHSRLVNLSVRSVAGEGDDALIVGFVVSGSQPKQLLVRGVGPALAGYGVGGSLSDPVLTLYGASSVILAANDDWGAAANAAQVGAVTSQVYAFPLPDGGRDAAVLSSLGEGAYSARISGKAGASGVALVEIYDAAPEAASRLGNVSARTRVTGSAEPLTAGFVVSGNKAQKVLIRAVGPTLSTFGVGGVLADPRLSVLKMGSAAPSAVNDDWGLSDNLAAYEEARRKVYAFPLQEASKDAALLVTLEPGAYSAQIVGAGGGAGVVLVEVYEVP